MYVKEYSALKNQQNYTRRFSESHISQIFHFKMLGKGIDNIMSLKEYIPSSGILSKASNRLRLNLQ